MRCWGFEFVGAASRRFGKEHHFLGQSPTVTARQRTVANNKTSLPHNTAKPMVSTLVQPAARMRHRLKGVKQLPLVIEGVNLADGAATDYNAPAFTPPQKSVGAPPSALRRATKSASSS